MIRAILTLLFVTNTGLGFTHVNLPPRSKTMKIWSASPEATVAATNTMNDEALNKFVGTVTFLVSGDNIAGSVKSKFGSSSPVTNPSILQAATQLSKKVGWFSDGLVQSSVYTIPSGEGAIPLSNHPELFSTDALIALGLSDEREIEFAARVFEARRQRDPAKRRRQCQFALDCSSTKEKDILPSFVGPYDPSGVNLQSSLVPWSEPATARRLYDQMSNLFKKWNTDEFTFGLMIFMNQFSGSKIDWVKYSIDATWEKGPIQNGQEIYSMVTKCGDCIAKCVQDESCKECLDKLTAVDTRDQVASYRTIVSYESELLKDFSFCILQKNNIFNCDAKIPPLPEVPVLKSFRGQPLTEEIANQILIGHLDEPEALDGSLRSNVSWLVACGANEAYDKFPSQHQLFYSAVRGRNLWYDPVFRVQTLNDKHVWCKRHYKVRPGKEPGTYFFSVLDNGITSNEFWTIVGAADDLSWIVFHYAGAASAVGQRYLGGLLCTPDGSLPDEREEVWKTIRKAGMEPVSTTEKRVYLP